MKLLKQIAVIILLIEISCHKNQLTEVPDCTLEIKSSQGNILLSDSQNVQQVYKEFITVDNHHLFLVEFYSYPYKNGYKPLVLQLIRDKSLRNKEFFDLKSSLAIHKFNMPWTGNSVIIDYEPIPNIKYLSDHADQSGDSYFKFGEWSVQEEKKDSTFIHLTIDFLVQVKNPDGNTIPLKGAGCITLGFEK